MKSKVIIDCRGFIDRRGPRELEAQRALEQDRADREIERLWRERVSAHPVEKRRILRGETWLPQEFPSLLRRQAGG